MSEWIKWSGEGDMPVPAGTAINVEYRDGEITDAIAGRCDGGAEDWTHTNNPKDIVAYYVMPTEDNSRPEADSYEELNSNFKKLVEQSPEAATATDILQEATECLVDRAVERDREGGAASSEHYISDAMQPIEIMQMTFTREEFIGFLKGNIVKYSFRAGKKQGESAEKDFNKVKQYKLWLDIVLNDGVVNPHTDII